MSGGTPNPNRQRAGRIGGLTAWSRHSAAVLVGPANRGFRAKFERLVVDAARDQGEVLTPEQVKIRADRAIRAHMLTLAARSAAVRAKR